jgi:CheY-like chemotaxis protein
VLKGGGVYSEAGPLEPTQRFWNLKQLGLTPPRAFALPMTSDRPEGTSAAFGDLANGTLAIHLVNRGGQRLASHPDQPAGNRMHRGSLSGPAPATVLSGPAAPVTECGDSCCFVVEMRRVLIIEDDSSVRSTVRFLLEGPDCRVAEAENGQAGLERARQDRPDLILCDLDMPVMDGFETLTRLREDRVLNRVPVIVVSGLITDENERRVTRLGARAVLAKPFSLSALVGLVKRWSADPDPAANAPG